MSEKETEKQNDRLHVSYSLDINKKNIYGLFSLLDFSGRTNSEGIQMNVLHVGIRREFKDHKFVSDFKTVEQISTTSGLC